MAIAVAFVAIGCGGEKQASSRAPGAVSAALGGLVVAKVGDVAIDRGLVLSIARARGISAKDALNAAIEEAVLAEAALRAKALDDASLRRQLEAPLVRALAAKIRARALGEGPFTDAELAAVAGNHPELSRPESRVALHALVKKEVPGAEALAKELRTRVTSANGDDAATSETAFRDAAKGLAMPAGQELVIEKLPPIDAGGRVIGSKSAVEQAFAKATFAVPKALGTSEIVETSYGYHVIRVLELYPAYEASREEKLTRLEPELVAARVKKLWDPLLDRLRAEAKPQTVATELDLAAPRVQ
ncbi:MAG: peptidylprolyl isomerase [Polyangiales bacterium]